MTAQPTDFIQTGHEVSPLKIALVGGGLSGLATLCELESCLHRLKTLGRPIEISVFDPRGFNGRGIPYSPPHDKSPKMIAAWEELTMNISIKNMFANASNERQKDFIHWLDSNMETAGCFGTDDFIPRHVFGSYLESLAQRIGKKLKNTEGVTLKLIDKKACAPKESQGNILLSLENETFAFDMVFAAIGHFRTKKLDQLEGQNGYFRTPYNFDLEKMQAQDGANHNLLLWGGEASIMDSFTVAEAMGYTGKYTIVTRAAENIMKRQSHDLLGKTIVPPAYEKFIKMRDNTRRIEIIYGFVHEDEIHREQEEFTVPITQLGFGEAQTVNLSAANLVNAALWEQTPKRTKGYRFSEIDFKVHSIRSAMPCTDFVSELQESNLIRFEKASGMMHSNHGALAIVGSPLMVGRMDVGAKRWSADHSWQTAEAAVRRLCDNIFRRQMRAPILSTHSTNP